MQLIPIRIPSHASEINFEPLVFIWRYFPTSISIPEYHSPKELIDTSITLQPQRKIEELENLFIFDNPIEIKNFLLANNYLIEILFEAPGHIYRIFGQVPIHIELHHDPEENWGELFIVVKSTSKPEEAVMLEERLAKEWFLTRIKDTKGKLNIIEEPL